MLPDNHRLFTSLSNSITCVAAFSVNLVAFLFCYKEIVKLLLRTI